MTIRIRTGIRWALALGFAIVALAIPTAQQAKAWNGCFGGAFGGYVVGTAIPDGSPYGYGSNGQSYGLMAGCDLKLDKVVVGAEVSYGWLAGNLNDLGIDNDLTITGRAGYLLTPAALVYGHAGWSRLTGSGDGHIDGWKAGLGAELKIPANPMYLDLRWSHSFIDESDVGVSGIKIASDEFRLGLKLKFGSGFALAEEEKAGKHPIK